MNLGGELDGQLSGWLDAVVPEGDYAPPIQGCKAVIAPCVSLLSVPVRAVQPLYTRHAGYSYSGPAAAYAYKSIDITGMYAY
jgi:MEMO1 family protein